MLRFLIFASLLAAFAAPWPAGAQSSVAQPRLEEFLRPGDIVRLQIWREPDLSGEFQVDTRGAVVVPLLGQKQVTGLSPDSLRSLLLTEYQYHLRNPSVEIVFLRRINVLGAVRQPGVYALDPTMTIAHAIALAGGAAPDGSPNRVEIYRDGDRITEAIEQGTRIADTPLHSGDQIFVPQRNWAARNTGLISTFISAAVTLTIAFLLR
jgi:polysaccharide biosynthesis/export protein VpsN